MWGLLLFALKYVLDFLVATQVFGRPWHLTSYLPHEQMASLLGGGRATTRPFLGAMLILALPFVWCGVTLTVRRLRAANLPIWLAFLFFAPVINGLLFAILSIVPSLRHVAADGHRDVSDRSRALARLIPCRPAGSAACAIIATTLLGLVLAAWDIYAMRIYGLGLFVGLPFSLGMIAAVIHSYHGRRTAWGCFGVACASGMMLFVALLASGMEGAGCLIMAAPLCVPCAGLGGVVGYAMHGVASSEREVAVLIVALCLALPALMGAEAATHSETPLFAVRSAVEIDALPNKVWPRVIAFPALQPPTEFVFRAGVAFPTSATINGVGPGAVRECVFSTGAFIEPIEVWDAPNLLHFRVTHNPPPMREWSPYGITHPPHLSGFLVSRAGQFQLTPMTGGRTRLEGATWYQHNMRPSLYWKLWSDWLIHKIHLRVLSHIRALAENEAPS